VRVHGARSRVQGADFRIQCLGRMEVDRRRRRCVLISFIVFLNSLCKSRFPHKFVNLFFILVIVKDKFMDLWVSGLLQKQLSKQFAWDRCRSAVSPAEDVGSRG